MRTRFFLFIPVDNDGDGEIDEVDEYEVVYNTGDRDSNDSETIVDADGNIVKSIVQVSPTDSYAYELKNVLVDEDDTDDDTIDATDD